MTFVGQLELAQLDPEVWPGPREGLLSFFCWISPEYLGVDGSGLARVLHLPPGEPLVARPLPDELDPDLRPGAVPVEPRPELMLPAIAVDVDAALEPLGFGWGGERDDDAYLELRQAIAAEQGHPAKQPNGAWAVKHRLLGWAEQVQGDVMLDIEAIHGPDDDIADWRLLLQVEADRRMIGSFGDGGALYFAIPAADLEAGRFDRVEAVTQAG